ncbi:MAG: ABC transporter ATP-binding protein/permease [Clostridia bacterium]|nr:ABC transporter ATP-binding protein/permease [Clostridia bacterium]
MKLMYDMPAPDRSVYDANAAADEKLMYVIPFNIYEDQFVSGWMAFTNQKIYKILDGKLLGTWDILKCTNFKTEVMCGSCGLYATIDGFTPLLCQFLSGRNLPRYAVICKACEILVESHNETPITNSTPERFCPKCNRPYVNHTTICPYCLDKMEIYKKLFAMTKGLRLMMCVPLIVAVFSVLFSIINPIIQKHAVDDYMLAENATQTGGFLLIVCSIVAIDFFSRALGVFQSRMSAIAGNKFTLVMRTLLYEKISTLSLSSLQKKPTGDLMQRINSDTDVVQSFLINQVPSLFINVATFVIALIIILTINPLIALFIAVPIPFVVYLVSIFWKHVRKRNVKAWMLGTRTSYLLQDILSGIRVVKCYGQEESSIEKFKESSVRHAKQNEENTKVFDTIFPLLGTLVHIGNYFILFYGYTLLFKGNMTMGQLSQITSYANMIYAPLMWITSLPRNISDFVTRTSKIFEILEENPEVADINLPIDIRIEGDINIKNVTFGYESYNPVLENVSVDIKAGEMIGIVGHSGSGKTTLINLIMRLYDVNEGAITIDDVNIKDISQNALRSQMGVVLQETFLFSGTIRDNIRYSMPQATDEEVIEAAKVANAHDFILSLPEGYNTIVGEKGHSLSGGERQRIAIARAVIHNPRILILDEATAALDTETEKLIQDALNRVCAGRTTLAIAHRLSTLRNADKLLVLDKGKVAEYGTHAELLAKKGIYYKLVMAQRKMAKSLNQQNEERAAKEKAKAANA